MKLILCSALISFVLFSAQAQNKSIVSVNEGIDKTEVSLFNNKIQIVDNYDSDTTHVRIGRSNIEIIEDENSTRIDFHKDKKGDDDFHWEKKNKRFNGHWAGFEMGFNSFYDDDYSIYSIDDDFMELDQPKSLEVNINFLEYNIALQKDKGNIGLVTGMGYSMNNYRFDNPLTIDKQDGIVVPVSLDPEGIKKTKLYVSYLTVPLLLEFQIPVNGFTNKVFVSGGVIGGVNIGSRTKIKQNSSKTKDKGSFNINPFKYALTGRVGLGDISLYATYNLSPLFKDGKGPELFPFSIGLSLINF